MAFYIGAGHEAGDFSEWQFTEQNDGVIEIESTSPIKGSYSAKVRATAGTGYARASWLIGRTPSIYVGGWFYFDSSFAVDAGNWITLMQFSFDQVPNTWFMPFFVNSNQKFQFKNNLDDTYSDQSPEVVPVDEWVYLEVKITASPTAGEARLWINGVEKITLTGLDTEETTGDQIRGAIIGVVDCGGGQTPANTIIHFDNITISSEAIYGEAPGVETNAATSINRTTATGNGKVLSTSPVVTERGFQYNTTQTADKEVSETGTFDSVEDFDLTLTGLTPDTLYYYRVFATNSEGTNYGEWLSFTTSADTYNVTINELDRTTDILNQSIIVEDIINDQQNSCKLQLIDNSGNGIPSTDEEITITLNDGTVLFAGYIINVQLIKKIAGSVIAAITCVDYSRLLDRNLVHKSYEDQTDAAIINDIVQTYCSGFGITTTNVIEGVTIDQITFNYLQPSQCLKQICDLTGRNWYIDYNKDIHYFPLTTNAAPFNIDDNSANYFNLQLVKDASQIKNRIYVRGGTKLSDYTTYIEVGDGEKTKFVLPDKPHDVTVEVDTGGGYVEETVGIKNVDTEGFDWYLNYQEKYIEQDSGGTPLTSSHKLKITYKYDIPILVAVEDTDSIEENGVKEFAIFDKQIATTQAARDRATAELTDYANRVIEGGFQTRETGIISGQYINIDLTDYDVDDDYIVQKVTAISEGGGDYLYTVQIASAKTMGIIRFLIELLEANKNLIELDDDEVVDELLKRSDLLIDDSLAESLTIDSAGPYRTWCTDSLETTATRAVWGLFEWGGDS